MLIEVLAHGGPVDAHELLRAWNLDPTVLVGTGVAAIAFRRGYRAHSEGPARALAFAAALAAIAVAIVSPLDALADSLASAHMVQHILLVLVAAPLFALSAPGAALLRGSPAVIRRLARSMRRSTGTGPARIRGLRSPMWRWLAFVTTFWLWHASVLYGAAVENHIVHLVQHATFFGTAVLVWTVIVGPPRVRAPRGLAILGVFTLALQSVFLSALLTFARTAWYQPYLSSTRAWGLDPLADQQLAGVLMWIPSGLIHVGIVLALVVGWFRELDGPQRRPITEPPRTDRDHETA